MSRSSSQQAKASLRRVLLTSSKYSRSSFVALDAILFRCGDVMRVRVRRTRYHDIGILSDDTLGYEIGTYSVTEMMYEQLAKESTRVTPTEYGDRS